MKNTEIEINQDLEALRDDARRLRADVVTMTQRMKSYLRNTTMRKRNRLREVASDLEDRARVRLRDTSDAVKERSSHAVDRCRGQVEHRPLTFLAIAFAAGLFLASVAERRYHH